MMRDVTELGTADDAFVEFMDACIQCRGCETACPAGVNYGEMMEATREALATQTSYQPTIRRAAYRILGMPRLLSASSRLLALAQRMGVLRLAGSAAAVLRRMGSAAAVLRRMGSAAAVLRRMDSAARRGRSRELSRRCRRFRCVSGRSKRAATMCGSSPDA